MTRSASTILFVHNAPTSFVKIDRNLLGQRWSIFEWYQQTYNFNPARLVQAVNHCDLVFCWFASWHSFLPVLLARLLQKPTIVIVGGYDIANLPQASYGSQRGGLPKLITRTIIHNANHLITCSESARLEAITNANADPQKITTIYQGISPLPIGPPTRDALIITVGGVWKENLLRKGLAPFVQTARFLPEATFMLVGKWYDNSITELRNIAGSNVKFTGHLSDKKLVELYQQASIYVQASLHEGFGMSVAEAMSAGCIPVVTRNSALPEVAGDAGVYTASTRPDHIAIAISQGLKLNSTFRIQARQRIINHFSLESRQQKLYQLIEQLLPKN